MSNIKKFESEDLKIIKVDHVKALRNAGETLKNIKSGNPFVDPTNETIDQAEKSRKALKIGRTTVERYRKEIKSGLSKAGKVIDDIANELKEIVTPGEVKQAEANIIYFDKKAWSEALNLNTKEAYQDYISEFVIYRTDADNKIIDIESAEAERIKIFEQWVFSTTNEIALSTKKDVLNNISIKLDNEDLDRFIYPDKAFDQREVFYNLIDQKGADIEIAEVQRREREAREQKFIRDAEIAKQKAIEDKKKLEAEKERLRIENEKAQADAKLEQQKANYENAVFVFDTVGMGVDSIDTIEKLNLYAGKLEHVISRDNGEKEQEVKTNYSLLIEKLDVKRSELVAEIQKQKSDKALKEKAEAEKIEAEKQKEAEAKRQENAAYNKQRNDALTSIKADLADVLHDIHAERGVMIKKYSLKNDILEYVSEKLN